MAHLPPIHTFTVTFTHIAMGQAGRLVMYVCQCVSRQVSLCPNRGQFHSATGGMTSSAIDAGRRESFACLKSAFLPILNNEKSNPFQYHHTPPSPKLQGKSERCAQKLTPRHPFGLRSSRNTAIKRTHPPLVRPLEGLISFSTTRPDGVGVWGCLTLYACFSSS